MNPYYCTDEDIANAAPLDYAEVWPVDQCLARGTDGTLPAGSWTLTSPSAQWQNAGLEPGRVIHLAGHAPAIPAGGELFGVVSATATELIVRRRGLVPYLGRTPAPTTNCTGLQYDSRTLDPQVRAATRELDRRLGVSSLLVFAGESIDTEDLRDACVAATLASLYRDASRGTGVFRSGGTPDAFQVKAEQQEQRLSDLLSRLTLRLKSGRPVPQIFGRRIER